MSNVNNISKAGAGKSVGSRALAVAIGCAVFPATASAQDADNEQAARGEYVAADPASGEIVVTGYNFRSDVTSTATKIPLSIQDTPQTINVINSDFIEQLNVRDIGDLASFVPGFVSADSYNGTDSDRLFLRGFELAETGLKRDGYRVSNAALLDIALIDRVEVLKGPSGITDGYASPGGVVNYVTKRPVDGNFFRIRGEYGSYDSVRGEFDINYTPSAAPVSFRIAGAYNRANSFMEFDNQERHAISATARIRLGPDTTADIQGIYQRIDATPNQGWAVTTDGRFPYEIARSTFPGQPWNRSRRENMEANISVQHDLGSGWNLSAYASYGVDKTNAKWFTFYDSTFTGWTPGEGLYPYVVANQGKYPQIRGEARLNGKYSLFGREHSFSVSADLFKQKADGPSIMPSDPYADPFLSEPFNPAYFNPLNPRYDYAEPELQYYPFSLVSDRLSYGVGAQTVFYLTDNLWILGGLRYDRLETQESRFDNLQAVKKTETRLLPRAGVVYRLTPGLNAYYSFSRSYVPVRAFGRNFEVLPSETSQQHEVGLKATLGRSLDIQLAGFSIDRRNIAVPTVDPTAPNRFPAELIGGQRHKGVELSLVGKPVPGLNLYASYAYLDTKVLNGTFSGVDVTGNQAPLAPRHSVSTFIVYEVQDGPLAGFGFGGGVSLVDARYLTRLNTAKLDGYERVDVNAFYRINENVQIRVNVSNLFDSTITSAQGESGLNGLVYADPREVRGSISLQF